MCVVSGVTFETCPECEGRKCGFVHLDTTSGGRWERFDCGFCFGAGSVTSWRAERWREGERLREDRKARLMTLHQEAVRLGIRTKELNDREWARNIPLGGFDPIPCPATPDPAPDEPAKEK